MTNEVIILVDKDNYVIGHSPRSKVRFGVDYHRATYILVFNTEGQLIIQKRTLNKAFCPGWYGITTGGVVSIGEEYLESAHRELKEELGFDAPLKEHGAFYTEGERFKIWGELYSCVYDETSHGPLNLQPNEVSSVHTMSIDDILTNANQLLFTPDSIDALMHYVNQ